MVLVSRRVGKSKRRWPKPKVMQVVSCVCSMLENVMVSTLHL